MGNGLACEPDRSVQRSRQTRNQLYNGDQKNFGPKIGFAYSPGDTNGKTVLRGGFGLSYNRDMGTVFSNVRQDTPFFALAQHAVSSTRTIQGPPPEIEHPIFHRRQRLTVRTSDQPGTRFGLASDGAYVGNPACSTVNKVQLFWIAAE